MDKPTLVIMAAGIGSRYGGAKQITPMGPNGERIIDYSLFDAYRAGFRRVVFIINPAMEKDFREAVGDKVSEYMQVEYVFQEIGKALPGFDYTPVPERKKPFGTCEAVLSCRDIINGPFAVLNADDYYGRNAFTIIKEFLDNMDGTPGAYAMMGYKIENTLTEHGHVARGICHTENGMLTEISERTYVECCEGGARFSEDEGETFTFVSAGTPVSMNFWGFSADIFPHLEEAFRAFLKNELPLNPLKGEKYLPAVVGELLRDKKVTVKVLQSPDRWYGVTYREDTPMVQNAFLNLTCQGEYPTPLWK